MSCIFRIRNKGNKKGKVNQSNSGEKKFFMRKEKGKYGGNITLRREEGGGRGQSLVDLRL